MISLRSSPTPTIGVAASNTYSFHDFTSVKTLNKVCYPSGPDPAGFILFFIHKQVMNEKIDTTKLYLCPNWTDGHKTCAKHRMWLKDTVCLPCSREQ
jgi:hypothetical protein